MIYFVLGRIFSLLLDLMTVTWRSDHEKDLELLLLRQQLRILQRKHPSPPRLSRWERLGLAVLAARLMACGRTGRNRLAQAVLVFKPDTLLKWHRELVRYKWTFARPQSSGRPSITTDTKALILRLAKENPRWGYSKLQGELLKLGYDIGRTTVRDVLKRNCIPPAPERGKQGSTWSTFLRHYKHEMLACDFFTVETAWLKTLYVLFFIELGSRRVYVAGCTDKPTAAWVTQKARQMSWRAEDEQLPIRFLIRDRDAKFSASFDTVFAADDVTIIRTPFRAPKANAFAERWVRSVRQECLDHVLILNERHLQRVLKEYVEYFNHARPHQGLAQEVPAGVRRSAETGPVRCRDVLGGIIHDYYREAA